MNSVKIAIIGNVWTEWGGGRDYISNIVYIYSVIMKKKNSNLSIYVVLPKKMKNSELINYLHSFSAKINIVFSDDFIDTVSNDIQADVCLPIIDCAIRNNNVPYVYYMGDLQEEYFPEFFSKSEIVMRRKKNRYALKHANYVLTTSESGKQDIKKYYSSYDGHIFVQPFAPIANETILDTTNINVGKYNLPPRYFMISNQFWMHKNHITAFKALRLLIKEKKDIHIVCTGEMRDYRNQNHVSDLMEYIEKHNLHQYIHLLGYIPKKDQIEIMKRSIAVIQPTLFEGDPGGCTAYEAVGLGKRVIMSNIPVNLEAKNVEGIFYFDGLNERDLARKMMEVYDMPEKEYSVESARELSYKNINVLIDFYEDMLYRVVGNGK